MSFIYSHLCINAQKAPQIYNILAKYDHPSPLNYIKEVKSIIFSSHGDQDVAKSSNFATLIINYTV